jgi:hypothetical protein
MGLEWLLMAFVAFRFEGRSFVFCGLIEFVAGVFLFSLYFDPVQGLVGADSPLADAQFFDEAAPGGGGGQKFGVKRPEESNELRRDSPAMRMEWHTRTVCRRDGRLEVDVIDFIEQETCD